MPRFSGPVQASNDSGRDRADPPFLLGRFLDDLAIEPDRSDEVGVGVGELRMALGEAEEPARPFLSVLLRTQGTRLEPFLDALLCLSAQTDHDFEVLVLVHNASQDAFASVSHAVGQQQQSFAERIRVVEVQGGSRGTPLNEGIRRASGRYIAVYDDDDILFANWVEEFHRSSEQSAGRLLRAVTAVQTLSPETWPRGNDGFRTSSWPAAEHQSAFNLFEHFRVNQTPFMSFAFPSGIFSRLGLAFDEELAVCEDWDLILRASLLCDVADVPALTSIYRRWDTGSSSYLDNSTGVWSRSEARVIEKLNSRPILLPPGSVELIRVLMVDQEDYRRILQSRGWKLSQPLMRSIRVAARVRNALRATRRRIRTRLTGNGSSR